MTQYRIGVTIDVPRICINGAIRISLKHVKISPNCVNANPHFTNNVHVKIIIHAIIGVIELLTLGGTCSGRLIFTLCVIRKL